MKNKKRLIVIVIPICIILIVAIAYFYSRQSEEELFFRAVRNEDVQTARLMLVQDSNFANLEVGSGGKSFRGPILNIALRTGNYEIIELLLANGANPNHRLSSLRNATKKEIIELMIKYGADVNFQTTDWYFPTVLHSFAAADNTEFMELLISHGADIHAKSKIGRTPLHAAAESKALNAIKLLLKNGADVNIKNSSDETPLHVVAKRGYLDGVKFLIQNGADVNIKTNKNQSPFDYAVFPVWDHDSYNIAEDRIIRSKETAEYLLTFEPDYTIFDMAWLGDIERLAEMVQSDPNTVHLKLNEEHPLFTAIRGNNPQIVEYLLAHGAKLKVYSIYENTPLQLAAYFGYTDVAQVLLDYGANVDAKGYYYDETALHWAAAKGSTDTVQLLLKAGANPNSVTSERAIDLNTRSQNENAIEQELRRYEIEEQRRANTSLQTVFIHRLAFAENDTPLHSACLWGHLDIVKLLITNGADVNATNAFGQTPLMYAAVCGYYDVAKELLDNGADPKIKSKDGFKAIDLAREIKDKKLIFLLSK